MQELRVPPDLIGDLYIAANPRTGHLEAAELLKNSDLPVGRCLKAQCSKHRYTFLFLDTGVQVKADDLLSAIATTRHVPTCLSLPIRCRLAELNG